MPSAHVFSPVRRRWLLSAALFGASTPLAKLLLGAGIDPWLLAGLLYLSSGLGVGAVHFGRRALGVPAPEAPLGRTDRSWLALVVLLGGVAGPLLLMIGLAATAASSAALLLNLEGLATMAMAWAGAHRAEAAAKQRPVVDPMGAKAFFVTNGPTELSNQGSGGAAVCRVVIQGGAMEDELAIRVQALEAAFELFVAAACTPEAIDVLIGSALSDDPAPDQDNVVSLNAVRHPYAAELRARIVEHFEQAKALRLSHGS